MENFEQRAEIRHAVFLLLVTLPLNNYIRLDIYDFHAKNSPP